jgi:hypothetical protein
MQIYNTKDMKNNWYIGAFNPTVYYTKEFEVGILEHKAGEFWPSHYHEKCTEINYLLNGTMELNDELLIAPIIFVIEKNEIARPKFITDCTIIVVKTPSVPGDKIVVD